VSNSKGGLYNEEALSLADNCRGAGTVFPVRWTRRLDVLFMATGDPGRANAPGSIG